jgi:SAM-dependent methyltransferase
MMNLSVFFELGMKRRLAGVRPLGPFTLNLGAGNSRIPDTTSLDLPEWDAMRQGIPFPDETVDTVLAFHFLEHLPGERAIFLLREMERVLKPGGHALIVVPHSAGTMAFQDIDHKSFWTEESFETLFNNPYYNKNREQPWKLTIELSVIMGLAVRNLAVLAQLLKAP